jgi:YegS/Rv2252/BmrU family lipid kinase
VAAIVFVVNPKSGNGTTWRTWRRAERVLRERLGDCEVAVTGRPGEATDLARRAIAGGAQVVVAVGGDGTIGEVVNGFFAGGRPVRPGTALAVLPRGTGGDFRRTFGWSASPEEAAARIAARRIRPVDVGRVRFVADDGSPGERLFLNVASFGVSGNIDRAVERSSKRWGGRLSFALGSLKELRGWRDVRCRVRFDGGPAEELSLTCLAAANGRFFGGGMQVAPGASPDDGAFDVVIWQGYGLGDFVFRARRLYDGTHVSMEGTRVLRARTIEAECDGTCLLDIDGEPPGRLPAAIDLLPAALPLVV